jgi:hypothetical protein
MMKYCYALFLVSLPLFPYEAHDSKREREIEEQCIEIDQDNLFERTEEIETMLATSDDTLESLRLKKKLHNIIAIIKQLGIGKRSYINIATIQGLLSVNDEVVQNITAVNLSATDEIISNSLTVLPFSTAGVVHNNASGLLSSSLIVNADISPSAAIVDTKLATISTAGKVANSATTATSANTASAIVARDGSGNFSAGTITASLSGNATTATTATNFSGSLAGEVTGTQGATVVSNAVSANTGSAIVRRTATGGFSAGTISITDAVASGNLVLSTEPSTSTAGNIIKGSSRFIHDFGTNNTFVGINSGNFTLSGQDNVGVGINALTSVTSGFSNTAVGSGTLVANTTGFNNIAVGTSALATNTIGTRNVAVGSFALNSNTTGSTNTGIGVGALLNNTIGSDNVGVGAFALNSNTTGSTNTAIGSGTLTSNTIGSDNVAIGLNALTQNTTGSVNVAVGNNALLLNITGTGNIAIGFNAGNSLTSGSNNIYMSNLGSASESNTIRMGTVQTSCFVAGINGVTPAGTAVPVIIDSSGQLGTQTLTPAGVVHNDASGVLSTSLIVNADVDDAAAIVDTKLATISTAGKVANSATTATSANTASAIVARDASGNFSAGTITANLSGNATTATDFSGSLVGDVTGTQGATVVSTVGGQTAANVAAGAVLANAATSANTASAIVRRTATGGFSAGAVSVTDSVISNTATITPFSTAGVVHNDASGVLSTSLIVNADVDPAAAIVDTKLATISTAGKVVNSATTATSANTASAIVARDASGNFSAGTITASLSGNATTATTATNFSGSLVGDVTGTQGATVVSTVGGQTAANVAAGAVLANAATNLNTASTIVKRDASGSFAAGLISVTDEVVSNTITVTPFSTAGVVHNSAAGLLSSSLIVNADVSASAAIVDTKLATISTAGKVANSATTATSANTASTIVLRDSTGSFAAQVVSVVDVVASGNFVLSTEPSTSTAGNILKGSSTFIHDFGTNNMFAGLNSGSLTTSGTGQNSGFGVSALDVISTGSSNTAVGYNAAGSTSIGASNTAVGANALAVGVFANQNVAIGVGALQNHTAGPAVAVGYLAMNADTSSSQNTAVGWSALTANTTGASNTAIGYSSLLDNTTGVSNTAVGASSLVANTVGTENTAVGRNALIANTTGTDNTGIGYNTLASVTTGSTNIAIGSGAGGTLTTGSGNVYINANAAATTEATTTRIGTSQTRCFIAGIRGITTANANAIAVLIDSAGQLGTVSSSRKVKHAIEDMGDESSNILDLRPVTFAYNNDETNTKQYGLIAEEVDQVFPEIVVKDCNGEPETVQYHVLPVLLLNEIKKQQVAIETLQKDNIQRDALIQNLLERVNYLEAKA